MSSSLSQTDYQKLYEQYRDDLNDLNIEYAQYKSTADEIQSELETQLNEAESKQNALHEQINNLKQASKQQKEVLTKMERESDRLKQDFKVLEEKYLHAVKSKVDLENDNEILLQQNRMFEAMVESLEQRIDQSLEELVYVQTELEENKNHSQEHIERLKQQLQETEQELFAVQVSNQKKIEALELNGIDRNHLTPSTPKKGSPESSLTETNNEIPFISKSPTDYSNGTTQNRCRHNLEEIQKSNLNSKKSIGMVSALLQDLDSQVSTIKAKIIKLSSSRSKGQKL